MLKLGKNAGLFYFQMAYYDILLTSYLQKNKDLLKSKKRQYDFYFLFQSVCIGPSVADGVPITIVTKDRVFYIAFQTKEEAETWEATIKQLQTTLPE